MRITSAKGLAYEFHGHGPTCLTLHGGPGMSSGLWPALRPLAKTVRLLVYDHRGHGRSAGKIPRRRALEALADDAAELATELATAPLNVIGHSNGAFVALYLALRHPNTVDRLVLVGGAASGHFRAYAQRNAATRATRPILKALDRLWGDRLADDRAFAQAWRTVQPLYFYRPTGARIARAIGPLRFTLAARRQILPQYDRFDLRSDLGRIRAKTLVIGGRHDWITPPECAVELSAGIPGAVLDIFEMSGHYPFIEEPTRFTRSVSDFLTA